MIKKILIASILFTSLFAQEQECVLTMGYKNKKKEPYISMTNEGLYKELYSLASQKIGCSLKIVRNSKKRVVMGLENGSVDFYPGFKITTKRAKFIHFISNELPYGLTLMARDGLGKIKSNQDIIDKKLRLLVELGGANYFGTDIDKINKIETTGLNLEKAVKLIQAKRADVYMYNQSQIDYYFKKYNPNGIKRYKNFTGSDKTLLAGVSLKSKYIKTMPNPNYDKNKKTTIDNMPTIIDEKCKIAQFAKALKELKADGTTDRLYNKYFN
jgi:ABC-type amino acid transport substrate-binding protein